MNRQEEPWSGKRDTTIKHDNTSSAVTIKLNNMENPPPKREKSWDNKAMDEASVVSNVPSQPDTKKKRSWKKPKDKPMRPLSAYNMFFQNQRERIVAGKTGDPTPEEIQQSVIKMLTSKTRGPKRRQDRVSHGQISFGDLARAIAAKWKEIDPKLKAIYNHYAAQEKIRYKKEVVIWKEKKEREHDAAMSAKQNNNFSSSISSSFNDSMASASMSSSVTSLSTSYTNSYNLSESISSLQNGGNGISGGGGVSMQLNDDVVQRQQNILRQQMGFIDSKLPAHGGGSGNDDVLRDMPNGLGRGGDNGFSFPRPIGGDGTARSMFMLTDDTSNQNNNHSMLESNLQRRNQQQQQFNRKEQLLLELQQQQLQQLQQLQQARLETSRLSNMKTTDTTSTFMDSIKVTKMNSAGNNYHEYLPPSLAAQRTPTISNSKHIGRHPNNNISKSKHLLQEQFQELEDITVQLNRLKDQERQMQQKIKQHQHGPNSNGMNGNGINNNGMNNNGMSGNGNGMNNNGMNSNGMNNNGMWADNMSLRATFNDTSSGTTSSNYNSAAFQDHNNDGTGGVSSLFSTFDVDINDTQRKAVRRSRSGDINLYRGNPNTSNPLDGNSMERNLERQQPRRHSMLGAENVNNDYTGFSSVPNSFNFGPKGQGGMQQQNSGDIGIQQNRQQHQGQNHGRRDSLAALLHLDDINNKGGVGGRERLSNGQDDVSRATLLQVLELQEAVNNNNQDIGSVFNMDLGG